MAIDGTTEDVPDTPENAAAFGRYPGSRGDSAFPQVKAVYLAECGTHAIVDAGVWPCHTSERLGGLRMLRSVGPGMLVMWDSGFHDFDMVKRAVAQGAQVLARLPAACQARSLCAACPMARIWRRFGPVSVLGAKQGECLLVRIIEYTITDPHLPHDGESQRLLTTLLDPERYPALDLVCAYHERWEIELVIDETDTHQRLAGRPLRSLKPLGVIQELYALLIAHYAIRCLMHEAAVQAAARPGSSELHPCPQRPASGHPRVPDDCSRTLAQTVCAAAQRSGSQALAGTPLAHQPSGGQTQDVQLPAQTPRTLRLATALRSLIPRGRGPYLKGIGGMIEI